MDVPVKNVAILGATGSIGTSALDVIADSEGSLRAIALTGHSNLELLREQAARFQPQWVVASDASQSDSVAWDGLSNCAGELLHGPDALDYVATREEVQVVLAAIVGSAGLRSTWAAIEAGKTIALANKETMVVAGPLVRRLATRTGARILPVDSEHSAVFQALKSGQANEVRHVVLTASGGPFLRYSASELEHVSVEEALAHPTWNMGAKITIDSATMMNKALEIIEARWLFDLDVDQIKVVVHPQSVVHSFVEYVDGSVMAQLSPPDMRLPIQYALTWPSRRTGVARRLDWSDCWDLHFEPPDLERFPALELGLEVARVGGTAGAVLNAANEAAVSGFLSGELKFTDIVPVCRRVLDQHEFDPSPTLEQLFSVDRWAREEVSRWVCT